MENPQMTYTGQHAQMPKRNLPRDVFLHLLAIITLYWSAISFVALLYQYIDYFFPLPTYYRDFTSFDRFSVASLIIVFPIFLVCSWYLNKIYKRESMVRDSKVRKWLIYLTLFIAALVIIGDLVTAVLYLLNGDFTLRFILKVLSILSVAGGIFTYYLDDVRKDAPTKLAKPFAWASALLVLVSVVSVFFIIGSPKLARDLKADQQAVYDLQNIQSQVVNYWQRKAVLPSTLADLNDSISGYVAPEGYEYIVKDAKNLSFQLCATFNQPSQKDANVQSYPAMYGDANQNWQHDAGHVCFDRTIDKQLYPPLPAK